jgi:hypothetical protein
MLHRALRKHGIDNFSFDVLTECSSEKEVKACERALISAHNTFCRSGNGYNMTIGGDGMYGRPVSEETRQKLREKRTTYKHTPETLAKMSAARKGKKLGPNSPEARARKIAAGAGRKGINFSDEWRANIGKASKGRKFSDEARKKMSDGQKRIRENPEKAAYISSKNGMRGKKRGEEEKLARSISGKKDWERRGAAMKEKNAVADLLEVVNVLPI